jgi:hypothetical protein
MIRKPLAFVSAIVAGTVLLAACGRGDGNDAPPTTAGVGTTSIPSAGSSTQAPAGQSTGNVDEVDCGPVMLPNGQPSSLLADSTAAGVVGCTEAFNVLDEYLKAPGTGDGTQRNKSLSNGWSCATDGGAGSIARSILCSNGEDDGQGGKKGGFAFHTEPG